MHGKKQVCWLLGGGDQDELFAEACCLQSSSALFGKTNACSTQATLGFLPIVSENVHEIATVQEEVEAPEWLEQDDAADEPGTEPAEDLDWALSEELARSFALGLRPRKSVALPPQDSVVSDVASSSISVVGPPAPLLSQITDQIAADAAYALALQRKRILPNRSCKD